MPRGRLGTYLINSGENTDTDTRDHVRSQIILVRDVLGGVCTTVATQRLAMAVSILVFVYTRV